MDILSLVKNYKALVVTFSFLLVGCGEELQTGEESGQENAIAASTPFAFVSRDVETTNDKLAVNSLSPDAFNPGARLYVRDAISSDANDTEILTQFFGENSYDVKGLNVSSDGKFLVFTAHDNSQSDTWNLYEYNFADKTLNRILSDDLANAGNDTNPAYTNDNLIVFSSDRGQEASALFIMNRDGSDLQQVTETTESDIQATSLKDGHMAFMRLSENDCDKNCNQARSANGQSTLNDTFNMYRMAPNGQNLQTLFDATSFTAEQGVQLDEVIQGADGYMLAIIKNKYNPLMGGDIVELRGPQAQSRSLADGTVSDDSVYEYVQPKTVAGNGQGVAENAASQTGWYSAFWPYRDGSSRMLVSWSQCLKQEGSAHRNCTKDDSLDGVDPRYGIWVLDVNNNTRLPVLQAKKNRVYTELALAFPNLGNTLSFDDEIEEPIDPEVTDPTDSETTDPTDPETTDPTDPETTDPVNQVPVANAGSDVSDLDVGGAVMLDGRASSDADGDTLTYSWRVISSPVDSDISILTEATSEQPTLTLLEKGFYVIELTVNDGQSNSEPDAVTIEAVEDDLVCVPGKNLSIWSAVESENDQNTLIKDSFLGHITSFQGVNTPDDSYDYYSYSAHPTSVEDENNDALPQPKDSSAHIFFYESKTDHAALDYSNNSAIKTREALNNGDLFLYFFFNKDETGQSNNKVYFEVFTDNNLDEDGVLVDQVILADDGQELVSVSSDASGQHYIGDYQYWHNTDGGVIGPFRGEEFTIAVRATSQSPVGEDLTGASFFSREGTEYNFFKDPKITSFIVTYQEETFCD